MSDAPAGPLVNVARLVRADLVKLSRYWVVLAGLAAIAVIAIPGAAAAYYAEQAIRVVSSSGYDFAINLMIRLVDLSAPILFVLICIVFAIDVGNGTVKVLLTKPVTRMELLLSKFGTAGLLVGSTVTILWAASLGAGALTYGLGDLTENDYVIFEAATVWRQLAVGTLFLLVGYLPIAALGVMVSVFSSTTGGAVIIGLILYSGFQILVLVPASLGVPITIGGEEGLLSFGSLGFTGQLHVPLTILADLGTGIPIDDWWSFEIRRFFMVSLAASALFFAIATWRIHRRDFAL